MKVYMLGSILFVGGFIMCPSLAAAKAVDPFSLSKKRVRVIRVGDIGAPRCDTACRRHDVNDFDGNADTRKVIACKQASGNLIVEAVPKPVVSESALPSIWTLSGGTGSGKLSRSVSLTTEGPTVVNATCVNTKKVTADIRPNYKLTFLDQPKRPKTGATITWDATLNAVSQSAALSANFTVLDSITYGFTISPSGAVSIRSSTTGSNIRITRFTVFDEGSVPRTRGGLTIEAEYTGCAEHSIRFNQIITTSSPLGGPGCTSPYTDPCGTEADDALPYYERDDELPSKLSPVP